MEAMKPLPAWGSVAYWVFGLIIKVAPRMILPHVSFGRKLMKVKMD